MAFRNFKSSNFPTRYIIVDGGTDNKAYKLVEIQGKKRALRAAGLPDDLVAATPAQSRWGQVVTIKEAKEILGA